MALAGLTLLIFFVSLGLCLSGLYFLVEAPAARKEMRHRLAAMQEVFDYRWEDEKERKAPARPVVMGEIPALARVMARLPFTPRLDRFIEQGAAAITPGVFVLATLGLALVGLLVGLLTRMTLVTVPLFAAIPFAVVAYKRSRRLAKFEEIFPDAIEMLARAVRAGHAFTTGFELIAREMPEPVAGEFLIAYEQQNLGMPLRDALGNMAQRVPLADVRFFVAALQIQRESGGNLAEILDKLAYVIRERFKLFRQVKVFTAEGRMSLYMLTAVPPITACLLYVVNRDYIMTLFTDPLGRQLLVAAIVLQVAGYFVMRHITRPMI